MTDPDPGGPNTYGSGSTTLLLPQDRTCKQQEKPPAHHREHPAFQNFFFSFPLTQLIPDPIRKVSGSSPNLNPQQWL
jgi:hypothetical protein